ncbi:MAG: hypothetical protein DRP15_00085 [Candidatus Aenigmatarchaeota archaeon]|nr:MAG: hypothetical protein DRP15_00085 [Candidatus Aenigmarchaeota archaeon]
MRMTRKNIKTRQSHSISMWKPVVLGLLISVVTLAVVASLQPSDIVGIGESPKYRAIVCVYKNNELIDCNHNLVTDIGKEFVEDKLTNASTAGVLQYISLSNSSQNPDASWTVLPDEITTAGLSRAECNLTDLGTGKWSCEYTFTATDSISNVRLAGYNWNETAGSDNNLFAASNFTSVNLEANDQLKIVWNVTIS